MLRVTVCHHCTHQANRSLMCCSGTATALTMIILLLPLVYYLQLGSRQGMPPTGLLLLRAFLLLLV
jgi:hypothetical protein